MTIKNLDRQDKEKVELQQSISNALEQGDSEAVAKALTNMANHIQNSIIEEARGIVNDGMSDQEVLASRGIRALTKEETSYYNEVIEGQGFVGTEKLVPKTVIDRVFEDLVANHPLLNRIEFQNTTGITQFVVKKGTVNPAWWGKLNDDIRELLDGGFETVDVNLFKLSAFLPVVNAMLELGPQWLDKYVRTVLAEASSVALEEAIVKGTGSDQPIGMNKDLDGAVVGGVYPDKAATAIADLSPKTLGAEVMAPLTKDGKRAVDNVILLVNPLDYWEKVFPETTVLTQSGTYAYGVLPIPATIVQSVAVPAGRMIAGLAKDYFMGVGSNQKIEASKEYRFLEDETVYITRMLANGRPKDNGSFLVFDISGFGAPVA